MPKLQKQNIPSPMAILKLYCLFSFFLCVGQLATTGRCSDSSARAPLQLKARDLPHTRGRAVPAWHQGTRAPTSISTVSKFGRWKRAAQTTAFGRAHPPKDLTPWRPASHSTGFKAQVEYARRPHSIAGYKGCGTRLGFVLKLSIDDN